MFRLQSHSIISRLLNKSYPNHNISRINTRTPKHFSAELNIPSQHHYLKRKFNELVAWYEQLTGMDEVRLMQNRVIEAQDKFVAAQEKRRTVSKELNDVQNKLKEVYAELDTTTRGEERYLQLITQEHAILKEERRLSSEFSLIEREERDNFTNLSACVKESHEKERVQAERTKYWSIIGSIFGTILGIAGSSINNEFKMKKLRNLVGKTHEIMVKDLALRDSMKVPDNTAVAVLANHERELSSIMNEMKTAVSTYVHESEQGNMMDKLEKLMHSINSKKESPIIIENSVHLLEKKVEELKEMFASTQRYEGQLVVLPGELEALIHRQTQETRLVLIGASMIGIVMPLVFAFFQR